MTEPVIRDTVVVLSHHLHLSGCPVVTCEYVGHLMFSLHIERFTFLGIDIMIFHIVLFCKFILPVCGVLDQS